MDFYIDRLTWLNDELSSRRLSMPEHELSETIGLERQQPIRNSAIENW
jgi:hypothetical protein